MKKPLYILLCIVLFIGTLSISIKNKMKNIFGGELFQNFALAGEAAEKPLGDDEVSKNIIDVKYIKEDGTIDTRQMIVYRPADAEGDIPLIYIPHYAAEENSKDFIGYIKKGWAVASAYQFRSEYNGTLATDDLVFNNAALYTLRHMDGIDKEKIALVGGSAGGYMTLMLSGLQMGSVCSLANSAIANSYFNAHEYFPACDEVNRHSGLLNVTMPIQCLVSKSFQPVNKIIDDTDTARWEAVSPVSLANAISSPLVMTHNTSDILVPLDQVTHKHVYAHNDGTLPEGFDCHMASDYPGILSKTFEEEADPDQLTMNYIQPENMIVSGDLPYSDKRITLDIIDDGAPTAKGSHANPSLKGGFDSFPYLEEMMNKMLAQTEKADKNKLILLLERYQGKSLALPAHENVDDTVYGSLAVYQQEIIDELSTYMKNHSAEELDTEIRNAVSTLAESDQEAYLQAWSDILAKSGIELN